MFEYAKTKIVCTIGPASNSFNTIKQLIQAGMTIARLNLAHGSLKEHAYLVKNIRKTAQELKRTVAILLDLPGPKIRLGKLINEPFLLHTHDEIFLSTRQQSAENILPIQINATMRDKAENADIMLLKALKPNNIIFINDGMVQLVVKEVHSSLIRCQVLLGGPVMSHKGVNLPGVDLNISAITDTDHRGIIFAAKHAIEAVSLSFVQNAADIQELQNILKDLDYNPLVIAKIERSQAVADIDRILDKADGIMVARGDLGVETPIEEMAILQKKLIKKANEAGKPVILATQMLESMLHNKRPTRAEATDVANAILDGADCVMLSEETAIGEYPIETVRMMTAIATATEKGNLYADTTAHLNMLHAAWPMTQKLVVKDIISTSIKNAVSHLQVAMVVIPTQSGTTVRRISRLRLPVWLIAFADSKKVCQDLLFSWGVIPFYLKKLSENWPDYVQKLVKRHELKEEFVILVRGPAMLASKKKRTFQERHTKLCNTEPFDAHADHETYRFEVIRLKP